LALGAALLWSLWDYATGIIGIPVLAVLFAPLYTWLVQRRMPSLFIHKLKDHYLSSNGQKWFTQAPIFL